MRIALALVLAALLPQEDLDQRRDALASRLETLRGLKFKTPVKLREGTRKEYAAFVMENARRVYGKDLGAAEKGLKALGLIPARLRLELALTAQAGLGTKVFASQGEVLLLDLKAPEDLILNKMDLVLVDQHHVPAVAATYDAQMAFAALRMGDAEVAKALMWHAGKIPEDFGKKVAEETAAWEKGDSKLASAVIPRLFVRTSDFTWRRGAVFAHAVYARGGTAALDRAWAAPPVSTEQVLHPEKYAADEKPVAIDPAPAAEFFVAKGYREVHRTTLGELGAALVLETHFSREDWTAATAGWAGDTFAVFEKEGAPVLVVWATEWDTEADAGEFHAAAAKLSKAVGSTEPKIMTPAIRRRTSVAFLHNLPMDLQDGALEAVWKSKAAKDGKEGPYGGDGP